MWSVKCSARSVECKVCKGHKCIIYIIDLTLIYIIDLLTIDPAKQEIHATCLRR